MSALQDDGLKVMQHLEDAEEAAAAEAAQADADRESLEAALAQLHARLQVLSGITALNLE